VPTILGELLSHPDPEKSRRVMKAMLQMKKIDMEALKQAAEGQGMTSNGIGSRYA